MAVRYPRLASSNDLPDAPLPMDAPGIRTTESPVDHALTLLLAGEIDAALRWAAAALERAPSPSSLIVTSRLLDQMGRGRAAIDGLRLAVQQGIDRGDLPLAIAAISDLRALGNDVRDPLDQVAAAYCRGSARLQRSEGSSPQLPSFPPPGSPDFIRPLSPFLAGPALASKATQVLQATKHAYDEAVGADLPRLNPLPLFSALSRESLREVLGAFHMITVPAGHRITHEGAEGSEAYVVARGEVELSRRAAHGDAQFTLALARLGAGAFFGEMALLSMLPSPMTATATRPTILLVAKRDALVAIAAKRPEVASQLAAHCRRNALANLGWTSPVVSAIPPEERARFVERLEMRVFERGDSLVHVGEEAQGLHLVVSGEVAIVSRERDDRLLLATLNAGETVGEVELVLCRQANADAIALRPTATLFLSRDEYSLLVEDQPAILHGLYSIAVQRHTETNFALQSGSATVADERLLDPAKREPAAPTTTDRHFMGAPQSLPEREPARRPATTPPPLPPPPRYPSTTTTLRPMASGINASAPPPPPRSVATWIAPLSVAAAFAMLVAGGAVYVVQHAGSAPAAAGAAESQSHAAIRTEPPTTAQELAPAPAPASAPAPAAPSATLKALPNTTAPAPSAASLPVKPAIKPRAWTAVTVHAEPAPAPVARTTPTAPSASGSPAASAPAASTLRPSAAETAPGTASASADDFGGRQ